MQKLVLLLSLVSIIMIRDLSGQTNNFPAVIFGDWYACGLRIIEVNDTVILSRYNANCTEKNCLYIKWTFENKGKLKMGFEEGSEETKIGFRKNCKWTLIGDNYLNIKSKESIEGYQILTFADNKLKLLRKK